jgi:hypothetical protein
MSWYLADPESPGIACLETVYKHNEFYIRNWILLINSIKTILWVFWEFCAMNYLAEIFMEPMPETLKICDLVISLKFLN